MLALAKADCIIVEEVATLSADLKAMAALPNDAARIVHRLVSSHDSLLRLTWAVRFARKNLNNNRAGRPPRSATPSATPPLRS